VESLLLDNLAANQSFDAALRRGSSIERIAARFLDAIMFQPNDSVRRVAIDSLARDAIDVFAISVQPAARQIGRQNAMKVLAKVKGPPPVTDIDKIRLAVTDAVLRPADRLRIVQTIVDDNANTLDNRLAAYWLEPGQGDVDKVRHLRAIWKDMESSRRDYDSRMVAFRQGELATRPRKPNLDFLPRFTDDVKTGFREQARRAGTDAETQTFLQRGEASFAWITVNASEACPDCRKRQGVVGEYAFWEKLGKPGSGRTVCGAACFCMLVPSRTLTQNASLSAGLNSRVKGVFTTPADAAMLDAHRPGLNN
jgi:hypothetical protein